MINQRGWKPEWRNELDAVLSQAASFKNVSDRRDELLDGLRKAEADEKPWVKLIYRSFEDEGADRLLTWYDNRTKHVAFLDSTGKVLNKPKVVGTATKSEAGMEFQRELITVMSWEELRHARRLRLAQSKAALDSVALFDKLLSLQDACPEADNPQEAAGLLGIDLDDWLAA